MEWILLLILVWMILWLARMRGSGFAIEEGYRFAGMKMLFIILGVHTILFLMVFLIHKRHPKQDKSKATSQNMSLVETLHKTGISSQKIMKAVYANSFLNDEKEQAYRLNDALSDKMAQKLYGIFISKENMGHFTNFFVFLPEYLEYFEREFFLFRYFLISFWGEIYIGNGGTYNKIMKKFNGFIAEWSSKEMACSGYGRDEFLSLAATREIQYRKNIPQNFDHTSSEDVSEFIADASGVLVSGAGIDRTLFGEDFFSNLPASLKKEYFDTREKIFF